MYSENAIRKEFEKYLNKEVRIVRHISFGVEPFYHKCDGVIEQLEQSYIIVRRTDVTDNGRPLYITFKYADFHMGEYSITEKD